MPEESVDVAIVGGGPSGLAAAVAVRHAGAGKVVVLEREQAAGGIPRHAHHQGYGIRDLHRSMSGPEYASRWVERATRAGVDLRTGTQVTGWALDRPTCLQATSAAGRTILAARAVVLATGCRERPRTARLVAGSRAPGVMTTGTLQQLVYLHGARVGKRAVVIGAEHVSFSAVATLAHSGASTAAMVTELSHHQSYAAFRLGAAIRYRFPLLTSTAVTRILGTDRVEAVEVTDLRSGRTQELACDIVVFTADWIPDHELAVLGGASLDHGTRGPRVDPALRTDKPGVFAVGNLLHGAETADVAAMTGRHVGAAVANWLSSGAWPNRTVPIRTEPPLHWVTPNLVSGGPAAPARGSVLVRASRELLIPMVSVSQGARPLWSGRVARITVGRSARLPADWLAGVDTDGEPVDVTVRRARSR